MKRTFVILPFFIMLGVPSSAYAQLVSITDNGEAIVKVLATETVNLESPRGTLEIKDAGEITPPPEAYVSLKKDNNNKISLSVESGDNIRELDVTDWKDTLIEVEERPETLRMVIGVSDDKFTMQQRGVVAVTGFPITIDAKSARISATTSSGERFISVLPYQAVESALRARILHTVAHNKNLLLTEENNELLYVISGSKDLTFFNFYTHSFPVESKISALNGSVVATDEPIWLKMLEYLFS